MKPTSTDRAARPILVVNVCCIAGGGLVLLAASAWPGYASGLAACLVLPFVAALGVAWMAAAVRAMSNMRARPMNRRRWVASLVAPVLVCVVYASLRLYVPRRIAFAAARDDFDRAVAAARGVPTSGAVGRRIGIYRVRRHAIDPRGGVFFETGGGSTTIDRLTFGFAFQPNPQGTPFGAADYRRGRLGGGWHWFAVSDDWHEACRGGFSRQSRPRVMREMAVEAGPTR